MKKKKKKKREKKVNQASKQQKERRKEGKNPLEILKKKGVGAPPSFETCTKHGRVQPGHRDLVNIGYVFECPRVTR